MAFARVFLQRLSSGFSPGPHGACGFHRTPRSIVGREPNDLRPSLRSHYRSIAGSTSAFQHRSSSLLFFACFVPSRRRHADTFPCSNDSIYACTLLGPDYEPAGLGTSRRSSPVPFSLSQACLDSTCISQIAHTDKSEGNGESFDIPWHFIDTHFTLPHRQQYKLPTPHC